MKRLIKQCSVSTAAASPKDISGICFLLFLSSVLCFSYLVRTSVQITCFIRVWSSHLFNAASLLYLPIRLISRHENSKKCFQFQINSCPPTSCCRIPPYGIQDHVQQCGHSLLGLLFHWYEKNLNRFCLIGLLLCTREKLPLVASLSQSHLALCLLVQQNLNLYDQEVEILQNGHQLW